MHYFEDELSIMHVYCRAEIKIYTNCTADFRIENLIITSGDLSLNKQKSRWKMRKLNLLLFRYEKKLTYGIKLCDKSHQKIDGKCGSKVWISESVMYNTLIF